MFTLTSHHFGFFKSWIMDRSVYQLIIYESLQNEYKRGISGWDFNLEDVKAQASLV